MGVSKSLKISNELKEGVENCYREIDGNEHLFHTSYISERDYKKERAAIFLRFLLRHSEDVVKM